MLLNSFLYQRSLIKMKHRKIRDDLNTLIPINTFHSIMQINLTQDIRSTAIGLKIGKEQQNHGLLTTQITKIIEKKEIAKDGLQDA